ncbi:MAG: glycosyl hydrolase family 28 protein [Bacillota bacterium]
MAKKEKGIFVEIVLIVILLAAVAVSAAYVRNKAIRAESGDILKDAKLVLYEGPKSLKDATDEDMKAASEYQGDISLKHSVNTQVKVNGYDCYVYETMVNNSREWNPYYAPLLSRTPVAYFDFEKAAVIEVAVKDTEIDSVKISPLKYGIEAEIDKEKNAVAFTITQPDAYTVTFNGSPERAVHIFAYPIQEEIPSENDGSVIYIGPGEWNIESIMMEDGQTLYLAGGAVVHSIVNGNYVKNIKIMGRGIIDGSHYKGWQGRTAYIPLKFDHCENVEIRDVIVLNPNAWACQAFDSVNGVVDGVKIITARPNGDGITLQSCRNYEVRNCFVRSWDDSLVVKNYSENSKNITFKNNQLWTDFAQSMEIGYETNKGNKENSSITDIRFENITVLNNFHKPVISVHNGDDAMVSGITFRDVTVENAQMGSGDGAGMPYLIDLHVAQSANWSTTKERGRIKDVLIGNVRVLSGKKCPSRIKGFDAEHNIENVTIRNLEILGTKIGDLDEGGFEIDPASTKNIVIEQTEGGIN